MDHQIQLYVFSLVNQQHSRVQREAHAVLLELG